MERMTFGNYRFPYNPYSLKAVHSRRIVSRFSPFCGSVVEDYGAEAVKLSGEGAFFGSGAEAALSALKAVFREGGKKTLTVDGESFPAFFTSLTVLHSADTREIRFLFEFTEAP